MDIKIHPLALEMEKYNAIAVLELPDIEKFGQELCEYACKYLSCRGENSIALKHTCSNCPMLKLIKGEYNGKY